MAHEIELSPLFHELIVACVSLQETVTALEVETAKLADPEGGKSVRAELRKKLQEATNWEW